MHMNYFPHPPAHEENLFFRRGIINNFNFLLQKGLAEELGNSSLEFTLLLVCPCSLNPQATPSWFLFHSPQYCSSLNSLSSPPDPWTTFLSSLPSTGTGSPCFGTWIITLMVTVSKGWRYPDSHTTTQNECSPIVAKTVTSAKTDLCRFCKYLVPYGFPSFSDQPAFTSPLVLAPTPSPPVQRTPLSVFLLPMVSVTHGQFRSENIT